MAPTRELAIQINGVINEISRFTTIESFCVFGGVEQDTQIAKLQKGFDILVATPGRMFDLISQGHLDLHRVDTLILDEADHMLDLGFIKDIEDVKKHLPKKHQTLFFSATINKKIKKLAYSLVHNAIRIHVSPKDPVSKNVEHSVAFIEMDDKRFFLERMIKDHANSKILVFVRTKVRAERVAKAMERVNINADIIHGSKEQKERLSVLDKFRSGELNILIATDVSARGIDIDNVDYVVNYDLPEPSENYVHRVGRTGRGTKKGQAISFCSKQEVPILETIEGFLGTKIIITTITKSDYSDTIDLSGPKADDWQSLIDNDDNFKKKKKRKS